MLLRGGNGKAPSVDAATPSIAPSAHPEDRAERRQVTVMKPIPIRNKPHPRIAVLKICLQASGSLFNT